MVWDGRTRRRLANALVRDVYADDLLSQSMKRSKTVILECMKNVGMVESFNHLRFIAGGNRANMLQAWRALRAEGKIVKGVVGYVLAGSPMAKSAAVQPLGRGEKQQ